MKRDDQQQNDRESIWDSPEAQEVQANAEPLPSPSTGFWYLTEGKK